MMGMPVTGHHVWGRAYGHDKCSDGILGFISVRDFCTIYQLNNFMLKPFDIFLLIWSPFNCHIWKLNVFFLRNNTNIWIKKGHITLDKRLKNLIISFRLIWEKFRPSLKRKQQQKRSKSMPKNILENEKTPTQKTTR